MMAAIDPVTQDLCLDVSGRLVVETNPVYQAVYLRLNTRRGTCFWDVAFGSTLHELQQAKITSTFQPDLEDRIRTALQPMIDAKEISDLAFEHERPSGNRWHCRLTVLDAGKRLLGWELWVEVT